MNESKQPQRIGILLKAYENHSASPDEIRELFQWLDETEGEEELKSAVLRSLAEVSVGVDATEEQDTAGGFSGTDQIWDSIRLTVQQRRRRPVKRSVAAVVLLAIAVGFSVRFAPGKAGNHGRLTAEMAMHAVKSKPDVAPGTNKAVLILASGKKIWLDSAQNGSLGQQGNTQVIKPAAGQLVYTAAGSFTGTEMYNSVETPRGGQYQVKLADGTQVWLNASSSLRFPTSFNGKDRSVELNGEAYFEVAKNLRRPFHVFIRHTDIKVLGTHFNVMGYVDERELRTTLLEGKVNVTTAGQTKVLRPGKAAIVVPGAKSINVEPVNAGQAVAWKNGLFRFHETGIRAIMRQVERWYDVDVEFQTRATDQDFTGVFPRSENLSVLLQALELTGTVHFQISGKRVIVLP